MQASGPFVASLYSYVTCHISQPKNTVATGGPNLNVDRLQYDTVTCPCHKSL